MVWWVQMYEKNHCRSGVHFGLDVATDRIFQTVNIMFDCHNKFYGAYNVQALISTGVNIFNIDRTIHDNIYYKKMKGIIKEANEICESFPPNYYRPVSICVTISILNPEDVVDEADILILKDVTKKEQLIEFKSQYKNFATMPILLWLKEFDADNTNELIKISDGVILDLPNVNFIDGVCCDVIQRCKKSGKPIIYLIPKLVEDYYKPGINDRQILTIASQLVNEGVDGVMLVDGDEVIKPPTEIILSLVKAIRLAEDDLDVDKAYWKLSFEMKIPVLPPIATAIAASLAALKIGAKAIIIMTMTGRSARIISFAAPPCTVLAITNRKEVSRRIHLYRNVVPLYYDKPREQKWHHEWRNRVHFGTEFGLKTGLLCMGAKLVVLAPTEGTGYCDGFQIVVLPFRC